MSAIKNLGTIAVMVPFYNSEPYVRECLDSLIAQSYPYWVAYVVDDGSPDASGQIAEEYALRDQRFRVFHKPNGGYGSALNYAFDMAKEASEPLLAVTFLDGDDWIEKDAYLELSRMMDQTKADVLFFGYKHAYPKKVKEGQFPIVSGTVSRQDYFEAQVGYGRWKGKNGAYPQIWNKLYKPSVLEELRFLGNRDYIEDIIFCIKAGLWAEHFHFIDRSYYFHRERDGSALRSSLFSIRRARSILHSFSLIKACGLDEKQKMLEEFCPIMLQTFLDMRSRHTGQFFENSVFFSGMAKKLLSSIDLISNEMGLDGADLRFLKEMAESQPFDESVLDHPSTRLLLKRMEAMDASLKKFRVSKYLKYKILSKLTFGETRRNYQEKYNEQEESYKSLKRWGK